MPLLKPEELLYAETHEWVHVQPKGTDTIAVVGISAFAVEALTDLVFVQLPEVGRKVQAGKPFGEIESVKAVSDLYSPVDGEVVEVNTKLPDRLEILSHDPYGEGWMVKIRVTDKSALGKLKNHAAYQQQCAEEGH
ncbi:MAG: glycine cleavage system protein GcvH [Planctomycetia bacterium]|nr:glycine cleavage system protein GcvH [Planctomycetia bacterium]